MFTYLGFCGVYSLPFFPSLLGFHNALVEGYILVQIRPRLIIVSFLIDESFLWVTIPRSLNSFKREVSFLSLNVLNEQ